MTRGSDPAGLPAEPKAPDLPELPELPAGTPLGDLGDGKDQMSQPEVNDADVIVLDRSLWDLEERYRRIARAGDLPGTADALETTKPRTSARRSRKQ